MLEYPRQDSEPPAAIAKKGWRYHHVGIPTQTPRPDEVHVPHLFIHVAGFRTSPCGVQWMRFDPNAPYPEVVKRQHNHARREGQSFGMALMILPGGRTAWKL